MIDKDSADYRQGFRDGCAQGAATHDYIVTGLEQEIERLRCLLVETRNPGIENDPKWIKEKQMRLS